MRIPELPALAVQIAQYQAASAKADVVCALAHSVATVPQRPGRGAQPGSLRSRLVEVLRASGGKWLSMPTIRARMGEGASPISIRAYVCEMHGNRELLRMGAPGRYLYRMPVAKR